MRILVAGERLTDQHGDENNRIDFQTSQATERHKNLQGVCRVAACGAPPDTIFNSLQSDGASVPAMLLNVVIDAKAANQYLAALMGQQLRPRVKRKARIRRIKRLKKRKAEARKNKASAKGS
jgi:hypothetical protein